MNAAACITPVERMTPSARKNAPAVRLIARGPVWPRTEFLNETRSLAKPSPTHNCAVNAQGVHDVEVESLVPRTLCGLDSGIAARLHGKARQQGRTRSGAREGKFAADTCPIGRRGLASSLCFGITRRRRLWIQPGSHAMQRLLLELPNSFARQGVLPPDLGQSSLVGTIEPETL